MTPKLEVRGVDYSYHTMEGETKALSDISFHVNSGEFLCIVGPSGFVSIVRSAEVPPITKAMWYGGQAAVPRLFIFSMR